MNVPVSAKVTCITGNASSLAVTSLSGACVLYPLFSRLKWILTLYFGDAEILHS